MQHGHLVTAKPEIRKLVVSRCPTIFQILSRRPSLIWLTVLWRQAMLMGERWSTIILQPSSSHAVCRHSLSTHFVSPHDTCQVSCRQMQGNNLQRDVICVAQLWEKMRRSCVKKHATTARTATLHYVQHHVSNCFT